ncbi:MAG TPA: hypothetical protein VFQ40_02495 [Actinomycetota bacterium]|nr:hypothetical protein [Actinomycetota bacterium]
MCDYGQRCDCSSSDAADARRAVDDLRYDVERQVADLRAEIQDVYRAMREHGAQEGHV